MHKTNIINKLTEIYKKKINKKFLTFRKIFPSSQQFSFFMLNISSNSSIILIRKQEAGADCLQL